MEGEPPGWRLQTQGAASLGGDDGFQGSASLGAAQNPGEPSRSNTPHTPGSLTCNLLAL